jgi:hypothetical protein
LVSGTSPAWILAMCKVTIDAKVGHLPRGFFGATGTIEAVELVLVGLKLKDIAGTIALS